MSLLGLERERREQLLASKTTYQRRERHTGLSAVEREFRCRASVTSDTASTFSLFSICVCRSSDESRKDKKHRDETIENKEKEGDGDDCEAAAAAADGVERARVDEQRWETFSAIEFFFFVEEEDEKNNTNVDDSNSNIIINNKNTE
jgi:hypothetical protein